MQDYLYIIAAVFAVVVLQLVLWRRRNPAHNSLSSELFHSISDSMLVLSPDMYIRQANPAFEKNFSAHKAAHRHYFTEFVHPDDRQAAIQLWDRLLKINVELTKKLRLLTRDGSYRVIELKFLCDANKANIFCVGRDVTESDEIIQTLRDDKITAEEAAVKKQEFIAFMSHEIRTPINAVIGMAHMLMDSNLNAEQQEYARVIHTSSDALLSVINDVLDVSRIESRKLDLEIRPFSIVDVLEQSLDLVGATAAEKRIDVAYIIDKDVPPIIRGDGSRLRQVLVNFLSNGVKFTKSGHVVLFASLANPADTGREEACPAGSDEKPITLQFRVVDTGIGVPTDKRDMLFRSFSQLDTSISRKYGGSGLGLVICRALCEMMGGRVWMESEGTGKGSTFYCTIVASTCTEFVTPSMPTTPTHDDDMDRKFPHPALMGKRVLILDRDEYVRQSLAQQAQAFGMIASTCDNSGDAIRMLDGAMNFDVLVFDQNQRNPSEHEDIVATLRDSDSVSASIPVIMLTYHRPTIVHNGYSELYSQMEGGMIQGILLKPVKREQFHRVLLDAMKLRRAKKSSISISSSHVQQVPLRILVAEDVAVNQRIATLLITKLGYPAPDVVGDGQQAVNAASSTKYDIILMDVCMPVMDGLEATQKIRESEKQRGVEPCLIVAMTANALPEHVSICKQAGMNDYLAKPIKFEHLAATLARAAGIEIPKIPVSPATVPPSSPPSKPGSQLAVPSRTDPAGPKPATPTEPKAAVTAVRDVKPEEVITNNEMMDMVREMKQVQEYAKVFLDGAEKSLEEIRTGAEQNVYVRFKQGMHKLRGAALQLGAEPLGLLCGDGEMLPENCTQESRQSYLQRVEAELRRVRAVLDVECRRELTSG